MLTLKNVIEANELAAQYRRIHGDIAEQVRAISEFDTQEKRFGAVRVRTHYGYDVSLQDAAPDLIQRFLRLRGLVERLNAGHAVYEYELDEVWWTAPAEAVAAPAAEELGEVIDAEVPFDATPTPVPDAERVPLLTDEPVPHVGAAIDEDIPF